MSSEVVHAERQEQNSLRDAEAYNTRLVAGVRFDPGELPDVLEVE